MQVQKLHGGDGKQRPFANEALGTLYWRHHLFEPRPEMELRVLAVLWPLGPLRQVALEGGLQKVIEAKRADQLLAVQDCPRGPPQSLADAAHPVLANPLQLFQLR